ncbi:hypothetical protein SAMN05421736_11567 [Evansella caseinilytica]|uniref:Uncharacterized protein n=1 Tax=Evansella caseinilytica TaxID=1503961 RepID=A0A1H3TN10_9BACI|nr:hypothetical protein [Evansella caseinilytica]SDZ51025.1 hypothetical protein SAMN05421736_11567 [Evansella caseinilytica]
MKQVFFILAIFNLGITFSTFIWIVLNHGIREAFQITRKPVKVMLGTFSAYIISFLAYFITIAL